jgi:hypothetical protein
MIGWSPMTPQNLRWQLQAEQAVAHALLERASEKSGIIRQRLAVVALDLRQAAAFGGNCSEGLLRIADTFEQNAQPGDRS